MNPKPKYSVWHNLRFMLALAWHKGKDVLALCVLFAALSLGINLAQLFIAPAVLAQVEAHAPLPRLLGSIAGFALALVLLNGLLGYVDQNTMFGRVRLRISLIGDLNEKACTTSYPNTRDPEALKLFEKAQDATRSNARPAEHVWTTLTNILLNLAGFAVYLTLLSGLSLGLIGVVAVTTAAGFFISRQINEWGYRHRKRKPLTRKRSTTSPKRPSPSSWPIRISICAPGFRMYYESTMRLYEGLHQRRERIYTGACAVDAFLSLARNGIAYAYLIRLTLAKGCRPASFCSISRLSPVFPPGSPASCRSARPSTRKAWTFPPSRNTSICPSPSFWKAARPSPRPTGTSCGWTTSPSATPARKSPSCKT